MAKYMTSMNIYTRRKRIFTRRRRLELEEEFFNGKNTKRTEYDSNGNIAYLLKNGKGYVKGFSDVFCQYDEINKYIPLILKFEGGYLNRVRNGKGKEYIFSKLKFEGE